ncbi:thisbe [Haematobia irritans]|uniref:thisbe n=1 Tax=Haematobia irritans TaxID=7368 RepID=UPI003F4F7192
MLPQLTVYAKIIYLLMVVISGALCTVEDYVIMSQCAHNKAIYLAAEGTVSVTDISQTQNITILGRPDFVNDNFKIALYAKETQRYLCFNDHWKLVGMKELQDTCYFNEAIRHGYFVFRSVVDQHRRIGFTQRGRAVGPKKTVNDACYMFTKIPTDQFFHQHNHFSAGTVASTKTPHEDDQHNGGGGGGGQHLGGRGSGSGARPNRHRNHNRNEEGGRQHNKSKTKVHGSGGGGGGGGSGNGNGGSRKRQRLQQMRGGGGGGHISGSNVDVLDPKNSSRQTLELSQYGNSNAGHQQQQQHLSGHNSHTGRHHNNNHSQPQYHHGNRHHHNNDSRRLHQHYEAKLRNNRVHHRGRITSPTTSTSTAAATTTTIAPTTTPRTTKTSTSKFETSRYSSTITSSTSSTASTTTTTTSMGPHDTEASTRTTHKRKGRRRKTHRKHSYHKNGETNQRHHSESHSAPLPSYDDESEFMTTDYSTGTSGDLSPSMPEESVKPTSATLPTWESWYPSMSTTVTQIAEEENIRTSPSSSTETEGSSSWSHNLGNREETETSSIASASASSSSSSLSSSSGSGSTLPSHYDISKESKGPSMPLPLPTSTLWSEATSMEMQASNQHNVAILPSFTTKTIATVAALPTAATTIMDDNSKVKTTNTSANSRTLSEADSEHQLRGKLNSPERNNGTSRDNENVRAPATLPSFMESDESLGDNDSEEESNSWESSGQVVSDATLSALNVATPTKSTEPQATNNPMTDNINASRTPDSNTGHHKVSRHRQGNGHHGNISTAGKHNQHHHNGKKEGGIPHHKLKSLSSARNLGKSLATTATSSTSTTTASTVRAEDPLLDISPTDPTEYQRDELLLTALKNVHTKHSHNTVSDIDNAEPTLAATATSSLTHTTATTTSTSPWPSSTTTRKSLRKSTQRLLATPFHQLTFVRNEGGGDIVDIDNLDNISMYPDLMDNDGNAPASGHGKDDDLHRVKPTSRFHMISGYFPSSSATSALPESIRIAKIKINRERKRMLRLRNIGGYNA